MTAVHRISGPLDDERRRALVYGGDLLVFSDVAPMGELAELTDALIREVLGPDPVRAQFVLDPDVLAEGVRELQRRYRTHPDAAALFVAALEAVGVDLPRTCWDRLYLRFLGHDDSGGRLGLHRDTWSSNVYAQTNWWTPIYPITEGRGLALHPGYWSRPLPNDSSAWDLEEVRAGRRAGRPVVLVPEPTEAADTSSEIRMAIRPGDLLCFSGAHLHAGVPNATGVARFSIEVRTVDAGDAAAGRGAPNVDGSAPAVAHGWFRHVTDGTPLAELMQRTG